VTAQHLFIPFATTLDAAVQAALPSLQLPHLAHLLRQLTLTQSMGTDESTLTPPHELALVQTWDWHGEDGLWPWAAWWAQMDGVQHQQAADSAWALVQPTHWLAGRDHITLCPPEDLALAEAESQTLFEALKPLFVDEGFAWIWGSASRWYAVHPCLSHLACAAIDRVVGQNIHTWLKPGEKSADLVAQKTSQLIQRLQSEVQLLLYTHPINEAREARGQLSVNSVWVSGCGVFQAVPAEGREVQIISTLREPALRGNTQAWAQAWQLIDQGALQKARSSVSRQEPFKLTLCGDRKAWSFVNTPRSFIQKIKSRWLPSTTQAVLQAL
jgi:hypothetical protein